MCFTTVSQPAIEYPRQVLNIADSEQEDPDEPAGLVSRR